jgi:hypothetical protein
MPNAFDLTIRAAKGNFFDRPKVIAAVDKARLRYLRQGGGAIRKTARNSIKPPPRKTLKELTKEERVEFEIRKWAAKKEGKRAPPKPRKKDSSPATGRHPPYSQTGLLRQFIFFSFDPQTKSTVIGPAKLSKGSDAPQRLEFGDEDMVKRPYMRPALEDNEKYLARLWKDLVK